MNPGSGDWWLYGQDDEHVYVLATEPPWGYLVLRKSDAPEGFDPLDSSTWGPEAHLAPMP